jgi:hypothetical protein
MKRFGLTLALVPLVAACSSGSTTSGTSSAASLVTDAVAQTQTTHATTVGCFSDFQTCINAAAADADVAACQATLASCLPAPGSVGADGVPDLCNPPARGDGDGDGPGGGHACNGDGGMMPSPPPPDGGAPHDGPGGPGGPGGHDHGGPGGRIPVSPAGRIALATCHAELKKCIDAGSDATTCTDTAHSCVHDALVADFAQLCAAVSTQCAACATTPLCVDLTARCAAGLTFPDAP